MRVSKRTIKRIAIGFGLAIGLLLVVNGVLAWMAQGRLNATITSIKAAGDPASLADLKPEAIPPDANAAAYLRQLDPELKKFNQEWDKVFYKTDLSQKLGQIEDDDALPDDQLKIAMRRVFDGFPAILPALERAASCDRYASLLDFGVSPEEFLNSLLKSVTTLRAAARFAEWKMLLLIADGRSDEAIRIGVKVLRLARLSDHEPGLISHLVSLTVRGMMFGPINSALRHNPVSSPVRAELDAELARHDSLAPLQAALKSERALSISLTTEQTRPMFFRWPALGWMLDEIDVENHAYEIAKLPLSETGRQWDSKTRRSVWPKLRETGGRLIVPAIEADFAANYRYLTLCRCLRVVNSLGEFRSRTGNEAVSIEQLPLPPEAITDPSTGKPLRIKRSDAGWIVYSIYRNDEDDGGKSHYDDGAWGFGPEGYGSSNSK